MTYRRYSRYLRDRFGAKVYKVSVDAGFTCPTLDGTKARGGCAYCNNASFKARSVSRRLDLLAQIERGIAHQRQSQGATKFLIYFQNYTNTYGPVDELRELFEAALTVPDVVGLSISTRPDCLPPPVIELLAELAERTELWLEVGLESSHDKTLTAIQRGHDRACFTDAIHRLAEHPQILLATHVIFGLPGESDEDMLETVRYCSALPIRGIKLHHLHVVKGTILARDYEEQPFPLMDFERYLDLLCRVLPELREDMILFRMFGVCPDELLIGPHWNLSKGKTHHLIDRAFAERGVVQGSACELPALPELHPLAAGTR